MFPKDHPSGSSRDPEDPTHPLYVTSHGAYAAGEQRHRHYDWNRAGLDPATHSFGEAASQSIMHASQTSLYSMQRRLLLQQGCCQHAMLFSSLTADSQSFTGKFDVQGRPATVLSVCISLPCHRLLPVPYTLSCAPTGFVAHRIHLCFQARMSDESQLAPHPRL